ncbi:N-6 DNA methylase [Aromatoleum toluvorans]|uniref:site-specific DNA-methyltransferase (adenine-specific) n=1 Tax=Aromatoleum toluvorans TaxID=92002 RepID=A0ABX1PT66_9RHOO|nr:N-6 DNA methylase [Aromatoleum toluvorans]NMG42646.1 N-6 DNA methylase [Aromatoleum toluvorans]
MSNTAALETAYLHIAAKRSRPWQGEEEVRIAWVSALETALGVHFDAERADKDSSYNNVIIEFKAPGLFKGKKTSAAFRKATEKQLLDYVLRESEKSGIAPDDYIGIAIDGDHVCFAQVRDGVIHTQHLIPFSEYAVRLVAQAIQADTRRAITVDHLMADFGHGSSHGRALMQAMSDALADELARPGNSKIKMLFEEWRTLYGQVADMSVLQAEAVNREIGFVWRGAEHEAMSGRLFVIHSYNSLLIKLLAAEIVSAHGLTTLRQPAQAMATVLAPSALLDMLSTDIERAGIFQQAGIHGFVEEAIFSWYLDVAREGAHQAELVAALRGILAALSLYRTDRLTHTRDVLRDLYQDLVPGKLRQSLGEFYTPDWLVDFTVEKARRGAWLTKRVLDPTCGSGAFLVVLIRLIREEAAKANWDAARILEHVCTSVWGFDLNPLAVQTARVNFLMEIADLLKAAPGHALEIPVLLADAIYSPAPDPAKGQPVFHYRIGSQFAGLEIELPSSLVFNRKRLDQVFAQMGEDVEENLEYTQTEERLLAAGLLTSSEATEWRAPLSHTYTQILNLHREKWNGIWFRIVRNFFWSATADRFDCIVGNPPWVRWSKLPDTYRERVKPTCEHYGIFSKNKRHGGNELDISAMITYTTADKWLKSTGRLAFVIRGEIFKNPSSAGFRNFQLVPSDPKTLHLRPVSVDDMKALKPFADATNHTVVAVFDKAKTPGVYPIPYRLWKSVPGESRTIPVGLTLPEVRARTTVTVHEAAPVNELGSPWAVLAEGRYQSLQTLAGTCAWVAGRKGITTDLNGVYFVPIVNVNSDSVQILSQPDAGKKKIGAAKTAWVEADLLYPLIKGAGDFEACYLRLSDPKRADESLYAFVPNRGIGYDDYKSAQTAMNSAALAKTRAWFARYKALLSDRSTYRRQMKGAPYYAIYNVGDYTFQPWKVVWPEMSSRFYAAVAGHADVPTIGRRPYVPDHKVYFAAFDEKGPAYFLCGLLNTPAVREWVESHNVSIQVGNIFKHMNLPKFDAAEASHAALAVLVERAHREHVSARRATLVSKIERDGEAILSAWMQRASS